MIYIYPSYGKKRCNQLCELFSSGCRGEVVNHRVTLLEGPAAFYGMTDYTINLINQARQDGRDWYYIDNGYFNRQKMFRVAKNSFQYSKMGKPNYQRWKLLNIFLEAWKKGGSHVLVCPPGIEFSRLMGIDRDQWIKYTLQKLSKFTDRELRVRIKPGIRELKENPNSIYEDLQRCHALVTTHSNAAVDALCYGVPTFTTMECGAYPLSLHDLSFIEKPLYPENRKEWAAGLANNQWSRTEIGEGIAWGCINGVR